MKNKLIIFGNKEIADLAYFYFKEDSNYEIVAFTVDDAFIQENTFKGLPIIPYSQILEKFPPEEYNLHIAISYQKLNQLRQQKYERAKSQGYKLASYISTKSVYWSDLKHGDNCFILENQTIQPTVSIGNNVMIWSGNHLGHGSTIANHSYIASHVVISGHTQIGERCFLGVNATIKDFCKIGNDCFIGMGANITKNMANGSIAIAESSSILDSEDKRSRIIKKSYFKI